MKIGILIDRLNVGGVEKIAIEQVKALKKINEDAYLVILSRKAVVKDAFKDLLIDVPIIYLDDRLPFFLRFTFKFPIFSFFSFFHITYPIFMPFVIKNKEFDYFIVHGTYTSFTAVTIRKFRNIQFSSFIWDPIGYILQKVYKKKIPYFILSVFINLAMLLDGMIISNSDVILVGGEAHNNYFKSLNSKKKISVIFPSVHAKANLNNKKSNYCLLITAWKEGKSPEYIFEVLKRVPSLRVKMAGKWLDPIYEKKFRELARHSEVYKRLEILGEVTEKKLENLYSNALFLLQINDDRGFGMPALEAAGYGTTFIIPREQGVCKLFVDKVDGFYVKEKDTDELSKYIFFLLKNRDKVMEMSEHAWKTVKYNYSWKKHAEKMLMVIGINLKKN